MKGERCNNLQLLATMVANNAIYPDDKMLNKRKAFAKHVETFHKDSLIPLKADYNGIVLMSAHQPNLFPYSGVVKKIVLLHAIAEQLRETSHCSVMELFCFADQDFADELYFHKTQLPSVRSKSGTLDLRLSVPREFSKRLMCAVPKPNKAQIDKIKTEIQRWAIESSDSIANQCKYLGLRAPEVAVDTHTVFEIIDRANEMSTNMADFNAFFLAYVIEQCGYDTAFARFSQSQQVFKDEISFILEHFDQYSGLMARSQAPPATKPPIPIWYHCRCDGKSDVEIVQSSDPMVVTRCRACNATAEFKGNLSSVVQQMLPDISLRAEAMLLAFSGIGVTLYVGGKGGAEYLNRASKVASGLHIQFPIVSIWRPRDVYGGVAQLDAILQLLRVRSKYNLLRNEKTCSAADLSNELEDVLAGLDRVISSLDKLKADIASRRVDGFKEDIAFIVKMQSEINARFKRHEVARDHSLVHNAKKTLEVIPSIIDHVVNIGIKAIATQWSDALEANIQFTADLPLKTSASSDAFFNTLRQLCTGDLFE